MRVNDWYFRGWEKTPDEKGKYHLVYTGEYYTIPGTVKAVKAPIIGLVAALIALYLVVALCPTVGGMWRMAAIPQLLTIIPLIYLGMGAVCLARAPERMTFRDYYSSFHRLEKAALFAAITTGAMALGQVVFLLLYGGSALWGRELVYLLGELCLVGLSVSLIHFLKKHPCSQSV